MRTIRILFIPFFLVLVSCNKDDDNSNPNTAVADKVTGKTFSISYYYDKDKDETADFAGYDFMFASGGKLTATKNGIATSGTWAIDNSDDDHSHFIINIGTADPLVELNDDWEVVEVSDAAIKLKDESGSGGTETLNFTKK